MWCELNATNICNILRLNRLGPVVVFFFSFQLLNVHGQESIVCPSDEGEKKSFCHFIRAITSVNWCKNRFTSEAHNVISIMRFSEKMKPYTVSFIESNENRLEFPKIKTKICKEMKLIEESEWEWERA